LSAAESPQSEEEAPGNFQKKEDGNLSDADRTLSLRRIDRVNQILARLGIDLELAVAGVVCPFSKTSVALSDRLKATRRRNLSLQTKRPHA